MVVCLNRGPKFLTKILPVKELGANFNSGTGFYSRLEEKETARWPDLISLQKLESANLTKLSKLTEVSVTPKPIERQRVLTVLEVFNEKTIAALKAHTDMGEDAH
jgi:hypothetical protein